MDVNNTSASSISCIEYVYTSKELKLHIPNESHGWIHRTGFEDTGQHHPMSDAEAAVYIQQGYVVVENAVSATIIDAARSYINAHYNTWMKCSKRQDDWRTHLCLQLDNLHDISHGPIIDLLLGSPEIIGRLQSLVGPLGGIFYSQIAFRTPAPVSSVLEPPLSMDDILYKPGAEYHLDGIANKEGTRFPDPWTVMVGIALVDIISDDMGNFTVFPSSHTSQNWENYSALKIAKALPSLGAATKFSMKAGDAVLCHVLLAHRGGKNCCSLSSDHLQQQEGIILDPIAWKIPPRTREMVFIRVQARSVDYMHPERSALVLQDPWSEYLPGIKAAARILY